MRQIINLVFFKKTSYNMVQCNDDKVKCAISASGQVLEKHNNWGISHDITKIQTRKLLILLRFYFHDV